mmetsp:Transcript_4410/g.9560  ORF Transcript_4410/g.9560 Transcript_4410/m.9560 type:complete len:428 (-) Transcript_4410:815-2098(-)
MSSTSKEIEIETEVDKRTEHTWMFEPATSNNNTTSLTDAGVETIANHKYKPGHYTFLDNLLNPIWTQLTNLLPMWLAPNAVTVLGGMHCGLSYAATWYYSPNFDTPLPDWVVFLSGYCTIAYYTFDCMDGKQARRTGQSSPLGQLFDHGIDCICNLAHVSTNAGYLMVGGSSWFFVLQISVFLAFFMAQWEEYHTGELTHAVGNFGCTEVNYGMGLFAIFNAFIDREKVWMTPIGDALPASIVDSLPVTIPQSLLAMESRYIALIGWYSTIVFLIVASAHRVLTHDYVKTNRLQFSAISKLATPFLIAIAPFWLPTHVLENETRYISICMGLLISFLTKKMICFSMAKQSYAAIQMEAFPYYGAILIMRSDHSNQQIFTDRIAKVLMGGLCIYYAYRLVAWSKSAIDQICRRLDINCLTIKHKKKAA